MFKRNVLLVTLVAVLAAASTSAFTPSYNTLTFGKAVALPGVTLPAGSYRFEIVNPAMNRDIVRVSSMRTGQVYFTRHTLRVERPHNMPRNQVVTFGEAAAGQPTPIRTWFPLDGGDGRGFVY
jgi:hypothetical protein